MSKAERRGLRASLSTFKGKSKLDLNPKPVPNPTPDPNPNFATAQGDAIFSNYSQSALEALTDTEVNLLIKGGVINALATAEASFKNDPTFSSLFTDTKVIGLDGQFTGNSNSETKVLANFAVRT
ncbi:hypothetical protein ANSO36C_06020 [Nostoc cf. commune SO-36]|uniref:Uncharacterized protein n=1 Tax=Nostoc cf. commune SO-36 TaxID=449208 RepID=A0ABM7YVY6_NOSCO|nr:hypothetical protein [Nostoc commune]BDI14800.1 hypothetical protein ANSO36C_06020 [Nostoc cf. commune SO-36]